MNKKLNNQYLKEIKGVSILNFKLGHTENYKLNENFSVNVNESSFVFNCENSIQDIHYDAFLFEKPDNIDYLYCIDENNIHFTLFDCYICIREIPIKNIMIVWNRILYGQHTENEKLLNVDSLSCIIENKKLTYRISIGKSNYNIDSEKIEVTTTWNKDATGKFDGVLINLVPKEKMTLERIEEAFNRVLEIYFFYVGYFADVKTMKAFCSNKELIYINNPNRVFQSIDNKVSINKRLFPINDKDFSVQYDNWVNMRNQNIALFTMFLSAINNRDNYEEVKTLVLIQCIEGYFRTYHKENLTRYTDDVKKEIIDTMINPLIESEEITLLCRNNDLKIEKIIKNIKGILGYINAKSLKEIIEFAIDYIPDTRKIFDYERNNIISTEKTLLTEFIRKAKVHRNFLSHLSKTTNYFIGKENKLAQEKLELLLRVIYLYDIGIPIQEKSLNDYVSHINNDYYIV